MWYMWYMCYMWYVWYMWYMECTWYIVIWKKMVNSAKNNRFFSARDEVFATQLQAEVCQVLAALMAPWHHGTMAWPWWFYGKRSRVSYHVTICDNMLPCDFWGSGDKWWRYVTAHWFNWSWFRMKHASSGAFAHRPRLFPPYHDLQTEGCVAPACVWTCRCSECRQFSPGTGMVEVSDS